MVAAIPRAFWIVLGVLASALAILVGLVLWGLSPGNLKPRLIAEVERATGRTLTIGGKIGIGFSLVPTISMEDVALSNPPGFTRPELVKIGRIELSLALVPLLRLQVEIDRVLMVRPDILLETNQAGQHNWVFARDAPVASGTAGTDTGTPPAAPTSNPTPAEPFTLSFKDSVLADGHIAWADGLSHRRLEAEIPRLTVEAPLGGPVHLAGSLTHEGRAIGFTGRAGPDERTPAGVVTTPLAFRLDAEGASISVKGRTARPRSYTVAIDGNVPDPSRFAALLPGVPLEPMKAVAFHAEVTDAGGATAVSLLDVKVGSVNLGGLAPGARLNDLTLNAQGKAPIKLAAHVVTQGVDSGLTGIVGDLAWLSAGASGPVSLELDWNAASARANIKGTVQDPRRLGGLALDVSGNVPNPALVFDRALPALRSVAFQARLSDAGNPMPFRMTSNAGDLSGVVSIVRQPRLSLSGRVESAQLDLDVLRLPPRANAPGSAAPGSAVPAADAPASRDKPGPLIPDTRLPFELLRAADASLTFAFAQIKLGAADLGRVDAALTVKDGILRLDPFTLKANGQTSGVAFSADASKDTPALRLTVQAPALTLPPLLAALGLPQVVTGTVGVRADLSAAGASPKALAASLDGWAGVAIEGGQLDSRVINAWLARLQPLRIEGGDVTELRCLAVRADAKAGVVTVQPIALNTAALILDGGGEVELGPETLSLRVRPRTRIGGTGIAVPVRVSGPMGAPSARVDISPGGGGLAGLLLGGKDIMGAAGGGDPCPAGLARARGGADEASPAAGGAK